MQTKIPLQPKNNAHSLAKSQSIN